MLPLNTIGKHQSLVYLVGSLLHLKGTGGIAIPQKGYVEANLTIPALPWYDEDVLLLVILDHKYGKTVPVQISSLIIDHLVPTMTEEELQQAWYT